MEEKNKMEEKSFSKEIGASFRSKGFRSGLYATVITAFVIVAVVILNLIVSALDVEKDMTANKTNSITDITKELLDGVEEEITIYFLTQNNGTISTFDTIFDEYEKHCDYIRFEMVDLMLSPNFAAQYTDKAVEQYSVIVVNEATGMSKYVAYSDLFITEYTLDPYTYEASYQPVAFDLEGQLNAAIQYVIGGKQIHFYAVVGHGETELGSEGQNVLRKANVTYNTIETMTAERIPEECDVLYISAPTSDYTVAELAIIRAYTAAGGDVMLVAGAQSALTNVNALYADYGVQVENGIVVEGDSNAHVPGSPEYLFPKVMEHEIMKAATGSYVSIPYAFALTTLPNADANLSVSSLLSTTTSAYLKTLVNGGFKTTEKEEGDVTGMFSLGMHIENRVTGSDAVVIASPWTFIDNALLVDSYANANLLTNSVNYMAGAEIISTVRTISLEDEEPLVITAAEALTLGFVFIILIPVILLVMGVVMLLVRRRK